MVEIRVPDLGDFDEVEVIEVMVKPGDTVAVDDPLITLETDKAAMDVPSTAAGRIKTVHVSAGDRISKGSVILELEGSDSGDADDGADDVDDGGDAEEADASDDSGKKSKAGKGKARSGKSDDADGADKQAADAARKSQESADDSDDADDADDADEAPRSDAGRGKRAAAPVLQPVDEAGFAKAHASPSVRKLARELGVDLAAVKGSGRKGRVTDEDVKGWVKATIAGARQAGGGSLPELPKVDFEKFGEVRREPLSRVQKISGPRLHASWVNLPHVTQHDEADITELEARRQALKERAESRGIKLTPLAFIMRACALTLQEFPQFNASLDGEHLVLKQYMHLGFAADTPNGLMVPVIRDADQKDIFEIADLLAKLSRRAREGRLTGAEMQGGCFTVSSLGGIGGTAFTPIINAPEVAILGVSRSRMQPVWDAEEERFTPRLILPLSLSYDHRVIDGADGARFTTALASALANVSRLMEAIP